MSTTKLARPTALLLVALGCTGLDPGAFGSRNTPPDDAEVAGFSFDAGTALDAGGRDGSTAGARGGNVSATGGRSPTPGEGGADDGGASGAPDDAGASSGGRGGTQGGRGGSGGFSLGGAASSGRAGATGGRAGSGAGGSRGGSAGASGRGGGAGGAAGSVPGGRAGSGGAAVHALFFSEYVEGSSSYKALEIQAREASTLSGCRLVTYFNGSATGSGIALDGELAKGSVTTLCSTALAALVGAPCERATNLTFNGDDAVGLECDGALLDAIGQIGVDPGDAWSNGDASTLNQTLRRLCSGAAGDPNGADAFDPALGWRAAGLDAFDGLGVSECATE